MLMAWHWLLDIGVRESAILNDYFGDWKLFIVFWIDYTVDLIISVSTQSKGIILTINWRLCAVLKVNFISLNAIKQNSKILFVNRKHTPSHVFVPFESYTVPTRRVCRFSRNSRFYALCLTALRLFFKKLKDIPFWVWQNIKKYSFDAELNEVSYGYFFTI